MVGRNELACSACRIVVIDDGGRVNRCDVFYVVNPKVAVYCVEVVRGHTPADVIPTTLTSQYTTYRQPFHPHFHHNHSILTSITTILHNQHHPLTDSISPTLITLIPIRRPRIRNTRTLKSPTHTPISISPPHHLLTLTRCPHSPPSSHPPTSPPHPYNSPP
jgi:hypothetical protein